MRRILITLFGSALLIAGAAQAQGLAESPLTDGARKPGAEAPRAPVTPRSLDRPEFFENAGGLKTPALPLQIYLFEDAQKTDLACARRSGVVQPANVSSVTHGTWTRLEDGGHLWTFSVEATGARALRLRIEPWTPPTGAELILYAVDDPGAVRGPIGPGYQPQRARLWTPTIYTDHVRVEYFLPPGVDPAAPELQLNLTGVLNEYHPVGGGGPAQELTCYLDVTCYPAYLNEADCVGALAWVTNEFGYFCSGAMLNRVGTDFTPLFMTARHCGVGAANADSLLVTWRYQSATCNGGDPDLNSLPQTPGLTLLAEDPNTDYTLVGMGDAGLGGHILYAGWNSGYWANGSDGFGIHHPDGTRKRITFFEKQADIMSCIPAQAFYVYIADGDGEIEPGSSGSPVFDSSFRVRGTASCASWSCVSDDSVDYGRLDLAFPFLSPWLDPTDPIFVDAAYGGSEQGTVSAPFDTIVEARFAVLAGSTVHIDAGSYSGAGTIRKAMTLSSTGGNVVIN